MKQVLVLNGPNLAQLGSREPDVYGTQTFDDLVETCRLTGRTLDLHVEVRQTDDEAEMIAWVQEAAVARMPVVLNPAAFTHYSYALRDALAMRTAPLVEVHMTNSVARREEFLAHTSVGGRGGRRDRGGLRSLMSYQARAPGDRRADRGRGGRRAGHRVGGHGPGGHGVRRSWPGAG